LRVERVAQPAMGAIYWLGCKDRMASIRCLILSGKVAQAAS
jgi:hypothetical protein